MGMYAATAEALAAPLELYIKSMMSGLPF